MKIFFSEEKKQKTFMTWYALPERTATAIQKSFASFLQKRRFFLLPFRRQCLTRFLAPFGAQMPKPFMRRHQRCHDRLAAIRFRRHAQEHELEGLQQISGHLQLAFVAGMVEGGLDLVAQAAAIAFLIGR